MDERLLTLLRPALQLALDVARAGEIAEPCVPAPAAISRYLSFAKLPRRALAATRRVLDEDDAFRTRVTAATDEYRIGPACWLFLARPDGWEPRLKELLEELEHDVVAADRAAREEARRRDVEAEARSRLERRAEAAESELDRVKAELSELRRLNREAVDLRAVVESDLAEARRERAELLGRVKDAEAKLAFRTSETRRAQQARDEARAEAVAARQRAEAAEAARHGADMLALQADAGGGSGPGPVAEPVDLVAAAGAVAAAAGAAQRMAEALGAVAAALGPASAAGGRSNAATPLRRTGGGSARAAGGRRHAPRLRAGLVEDTVEAADYLARLPGVLFLIDGYNVSKTGWPELDLPEQRRRLVNAVCDLHARLGPHAEVVFDGVGDDARLLTRAMPPSVRVRFSPHDVEADDVVLSRVEDCAVGCPVVVVSTDRRVQEGARALGAAVVSSATLLDLIR